MGAVVPLPRNEQENDDLLAAWDTCASMATQSYQLALGMDDITNQGQWRDVNGNAVTFFNWLYSRPTSLENRENAAMFGSRHVNRGKWIDFSYNWQADVLCQLSNYIRETELSNCTVDDIVLECSPSNIALSIPKCFFDDKKIETSEIFIGESIAKSSGDGDNCQG